MDDMFEDIAFDDDMPSNKSSHGYKGHRSRSHEGINDSDHHDKRRKGQKHTQSSSTFRKAYRGTNIEDSKDPDEDRRKHDEKLLQVLSECLEEYSRQRLRAMHMSFRQYGNDESKMTNKEMMTSLQENGVSIPSRTLKALTAKFESPKGIDLEGMYKFITDAHSKTGRDSVLAMHKRNDLRRVDVSQEDIDEDLLWRIESQLIKSHSYIDIPTLRAEFQRKDLSKCGKIDANQMKQICTDQQTPIFGALLKNLIKRCDDDKNDNISWPEFISFLEKAQANAWASCPSLKELPEKMKNLIPVAPSPLDELSSRTRTTLVNKLMKKSLAKKPGPPDIVVDNTAIDENQNKPRNDTIKTNNNVAIDSVDQSLGIATVKGHNPVVGKTNKQHDGQRSANLSMASQRTTDRDKVKVKIAEEKQEITDTKTDNTDAETRLQEQDDDVEQNYYALADDKANSGNDTAGKSKSKTEEPPSHSAIPTEDSKTTHKVPVDIRIEHPSQENTPSRKADDQQIKMADSDVKLVDTTVKKVTINDGQSVPVKPTDEVNVRKQQDKGLRKETKLTVNVKGKCLEFTVDEDFLERQLIDPPIERMKMIWVYGYRGNDCRKNMHVVASGEVVYFMSFVAVIYNKETQKQKHYKEHTEDIKCIDVHSNKIVVATGQFASRKNSNIQAHIRVWRSDTLQTLNVIGAGQFEKSVACVAFAPGKDILAAVDNSLEKKLTIWNTVSGELKGHDLLNTELVCDIGFNPKEPDILVTMGKGHVCWWTIYPDSMTVQPSATPDFEKFLRAKFVICLTYTDKGDLVTGDSNGTIYIFGDGGHKITNYVKHAHDGPVFTVLCYKGHILSGGRDGIVHCWQWGKNMDSTGFIEVPKTEGGIRMLRVCDNKLLVGTTMNSILVITMSEGEFPLQGASIDAMAMTQCHYDDLRGITAVTKSTTDILTAGLDGIVCGFNSKDRRSVFKFQIKGNQYVCIDSDETGTVIVLGTKDGHIHILEYQEGRWEVLVNRKLCKDRIDCIKLSPECDSIAAGSHDSSIYIYSRLQKTFVWEFVGKLKGHTGPVNGIDWSSGKTEEGYLIRSSSSTMELKFWLSASLGSIVNTTVISQTQWASNSVLTDVSIAGILATKCVGETEMTSLCVNPAETLVAMGDNCGNLNLFRYPCSLNGMFCHAYKSHATVHGVRFTPCGKYAMSVGGRDSCLMQWELI